MNLNRQFDSGPTLPFPVWGEGLFFYFDDDLPTQGLYISSGSSWEKMTANGTAAIVLNKTSVGLGNVDNTQPEVQLLLLYRVI
jgi:hypothetical protein